ncbi:unnamed protein product [Mytilus edulis]|uniref:Uncharacterized protein n=1 Tax=Mytilus edulis TaxID=6550 RepID=A0A8S3QIK8_MYTED|nr:unnamed protein product [Mytilus edulis]
MCYSNRTTTLNDYEVCSAYANETVNEQNGSFEFTDTTADADADAEADAPPDADDEDDADAPVPNDTSADALAVDVFDDFADALADVAAEAFADTVSNSKHDFSNKQRSTVLLKLSGGSFRSSDRPSTMSEELPRNHPLPVELMATMQTSIHTRRAIGRS